MRDFENGVARRVKAGEVVEYSATPLYSPGVLPPSSVLVTALGSRGAPSARLIHNPAAPQTTIDTLIKVLAPPINPFEAFSGPWEPIEAELGVGLPQDYKDFIRLYGSGYFLQFLGVYVPRSRNPHLRLQRVARVVCEGLSSLTPLEDPPYPYWPARGGLLPFGGTDNGDDLFWLTRGAPDDWKVVVQDRGFDRFETFDCDLSEFIAGLVTGEIQPEEFPEDLLPCDRPFIPHAAWVGPAEPPWSANCSASWRADWRRW